MRTATRARLSEVISLACRAPSVHNTQPWRWRIVGPAIELYADRSRQLPVADPEGRNLAISCGAAVHHAGVSARALGLVPETDLVPDSANGDLLARIRLSPGRPPTDAAEQLATLERRCTDRRRFTSWPIPDSKLQRLAEAASGWGAHALPLTDVTARFRAELLLDRAISLQAADPRFAAEQASWVEHTSTDGVPASSATPPVTRRTERPNRFAPRAVDDATTSHRPVESSDGLVALCSAHDDQLAWLQAGQALSAMWLAATADGLSLVPLSQVVEVPETRHALHHDVFADLARPQLLVRIGWQEIARATLPRTPRRPLADVLVD